jgi:hypothetical protein
VTRIDNHLFVTGPEQRRNHCFSDRPNESFGVRDESQSPPVQRDAY